MKKIINIILIFSVVLTCFGGCVSDYEKQPQETTSVTESTTELHTEKETTTKEPETEETTTEKETTTQKPETQKSTTVKQTTTKKDVTTRKPSTTKKVTTTVPVTRAPLKIDFDDIKLEGIDPDKPMIALTFDDGPSIHTPRLLDFFAEYGGKGTFFVVGNLLEGRKETVQRITDEGHEIASHSWSHPDLSRLSAERVKKEMTKTHNKIFEITGVESKLMRPPYGSYNKTVKNYAYDCREAVVTWCVDTLDWKTRNADAVYKSVMNSASDGAIILCHDLHGTTVDAMERVIPELIEKGYQLVTVSQLFACRKGEIFAGQVYYRG